MNVRQGNALQSVGDFFKNLGYKTKKSLKGFLRKNQVMRADLVCF